MIRRTVAAGLLLAISGAACSGGSDGGAGASGVVLTMLAAVPDTAANRSLVTVTDYAALAAGAGQDWPPAGVGEGEAAAVNAFVEALVVDNDLAAPSSLAESMPGADDWRTEFGFTIFDVTADVETGAGPARLTVYLTGVEPDTIAEAVRSDPTWSADLHEATYGDATVYSWADPTDSVVDRASGARRLGQGGALGVTGGGRVVRAVDPAVLEAGLDTLAGERSSLADDDRYRALARALDGHRCYTAVLSDEVPAARPSSLDSPEEAADLVATTPTLPPYLALGIGETVDDEGSPMEVLAFATAGPDQAAELVERFETVVAEGSSLEGGEPWSQQVVIRAASIEEAVAVIVIEPATPGLGWHAFARRDSLLAIGR